MINFGVAISWMVVSPLALVTDIIAIVIIAHYFPFFHGTDVTLISIMTAMAGNAIFVLPIPAYLEITETSWTPSLCIGYVWCVFTFRLSQILSLMVISIHWSTLLKMSAQKKKYFSTKFLKITIVFIWICSAIFGLLPFIGVAEDTFNEEKTCKFLAFNIGGGYGLFFLIIIITAMFVSVLCASDAMILIKHMKVVAKTKYQAGRFHIPDRRADLPLHGNTSLAEKYHRLQFAWDLSKFALVFVTMSFILNHLPYAVMQGIQTFTKVDRGILEVISLYLVGLDALLIPHTLWFLSRRYRHALTYQWQVHVLRNKEKEEDEPYSCTLQSYTQRERDRASVVPSRPSSIGRSGGVSATGTMRSTKSETISRETNQINGQTRIQTLFSEDGRGSLHHPQDARANGVIKGEVHVERPPSIYDERPVDIQDLDIKPKQTILNSSNARVIAEDSSSTSTHLKQTPSFSQRHDVTRSSSGRPGRDWKEHVRKKHLPPIFVNEGFVVGDNSPTVENQSVKSITKSGPLPAGVNSLHFYMSSDYHPDCLTESLPRNKLVHVHGPSTESDTGEPYTNDDIDEVLENESITDMQIVKARTAHVYNKESNINKFSTFKNVPNEESTAGSSTKGVYGTFEDLSQMYLRDESEIELDTNDIILDDISDGYNEDKRYSRNVNTISYGAQHFNFTSFKPSDNTILGDSKSTQEFQLPVKHLRKSPFADSRDLQFESTSFMTTFKENDKRSPLEDKTPYVQTHALNAGPQYFNQSSHSDVNKFSAHSYEGIPMRNASQTFGNQTNDKLSMSNRDTQIDFGDSSGFSVSSMNAFSQKREQEINIRKKQDNSIDDENASSGSSSSVTVSPYKGETRRRPWMSDFDLQNDEYSEIREPLVQDSDTDTLRDSQESSDLRFGLIYDQKLAVATHSGLSTPVSSIFDEETERGFEDALEQHISSGANVYGGVGFCFESIKEEPEDLTSSGSNPFLDNLSNGDEDFRTQAVISRSSNSRTSSSESISDNPFSSSPGLAHSRENIRTSRPSEIKYKAPVIITTDTDAEFGDSGFTSGLDRGNLSDSSDHQEISLRGRNSPWPEDEETPKELEMSFESNFCANEKGLSSSNGSNSFTVNNDGSGNTADTRLNKLKRDETKRPVNKVLENVRSDTRPQPMRVKSFERTSPSPARKLPRRGHSFEEPRINVKPAYF